MSKEYYCRIFGTKVRWEKVTEYVFKNRKNALDDAKTLPRYCDDYVIKDTVTNVLVVSYSGPPEGIAQMYKFLSVKEAGTFVDGYYSEPTHIHFTSRNNSQFLFDIKENCEYRVVKRKAS